MTTEPWAAAELHVLDNPDHEVKVTMKDNLISIDCQTCNWWDEQ